MFPIIHLGRPWLAFWLVPYPNERLLWPNLRSPLVWDFFAIVTYLTGSMLFLFLPMIPDFGIVRDKTTGVRRRIYGALALGWRGTPKQWHRLETAMQIMAIAIIPVAVSVHTIVSFDFSMAPVPMWQSTIFGPYFVAGAIFSGIAGLIIAMAALRRFLRLEAYLLPVHFDNLGRLLLVMALLWGYFVFNERLVIYYGNRPSEMTVFQQTQHGDYAALYWTMVVCNFLLPLVILGIRRFRTIAGAVVASVGVILGMWIERYLIVVPSLGHKYLPYSFGTYSPQAVEVIITAATFASMCLLYVLFAKTVPIISAWELRAGARTDLAPDAPAGDGTGEITRRATALYALYPGGAAAQRAVDRLRAIGLAAREITVLSSEPMDEYEFADRDRSTWMWWIASGGGLAGMAFGLALTRVAATSWPMNVGGLPTFAWWPSLIVIFELTMLGAIIATVTTLAVTAGLGRGRGTLYDPAVSDGKVLVGIENPPAGLDARIEGALAATTRVDLQSVEG
jgi:Ni/Fe-hydrogenase subunit HybB-like protein